jgi:hypothetical protein
MDSTTCEEITVNASVSDFLRGHGAHRELAKICELARSAFPAMIGLEFTLQEDPDEIGRARVVICVTLPDLYSDERLQAGIRRYHEQVIAQVPLDHCPLFALVTEFASE